MSDTHYCDIFTDCYHCPVPFCPYEKLDSWYEHTNYVTDDEIEQDDEEIEDDDE